MALSSPIDFTDWDTADAGEGCWQPFAQIDDPMEGLRIVPAQAMLTVGRGNVPPALWVSGVQDGGGRARVAWVIDEPDDPSRVTIYWADADAGEGVVAANLPLSAGTQTASYELDLHRLPARPVWLRLELTSGDGGWCHAWSRDSLVGADDDAGTLARDAGPPDAGGTMAPPRGCGCDGALSAWAYRARLA